MENILNQNVSFSLGTVILIIIVLLLGNTFLQLLMRFFFSERRKLNDELKLIEIQKENLNGIIEDKVNEQVKKYQLEAKIHKLSDVFTAIEHLRRNTPEYSHQTKYFDEVNPNLLDLDKEQFDDMTEHIIGLLKYHTNLSYQRYLKENNLS